ncbi:MotA/TolQ/ExbB proton channel family protein [Alterisphingorhabdus coralli]|uniref:MotA/TolQ/ExbB proton channel family protein n=1 Tax=Alterisphingorhabdus coralli TaxID=3071408 RepID=A0AA97I2S8_9SPHN|nr:MotA/TolQ/ExbB proton channel family protein [Parasphingorhabdus sp. SCSIO 66989]WOE76578.1 MotA/TolQ/ExbB proton channel family protein [Parasphingorhabdus sp. SCSIO 66989]
MSEQPSICRKLSVKAGLCVAMLLPLSAASAAEAPSTMSPVEQLFDAGGPIIVILAVLAVLALAVALVKFVQFYLLSVGRSNFVGDVVTAIREGRHADALADLEPRKSPVARVMMAAVRGNADPQMDDTIVREETTRIAQAQLDGLERGLAVISLIATIAPLLGLLGTVLGMIEAFQQMETVGDSIEPAVLAGGIWEALLTTAAGLAVAIPAAVLFTWLQRSVDVEAQHMEDAATQVFTIPLYENEPENRPQDAKMPSAVT